jgi:hypothetical protein
MTDYRDIFKGRNIMTPTFITWGKKGNVYYELTEGRGLTNNPIFGVTVRDSKGNRLEPDLSKLFHSLTSANEYIETLK